MTRLLLLCFVAFAVHAQELDLDRYVQRLRLAPGTSIEDKIKALDGLGITLSRQGLLQLQNESRAGAYAPPAPTIQPYTFGTSPQLRSGDGNAKPLGSLNSNQYDPNSVANPYGRYGSQYSPDSVNNPYGQYGSPYSPYSATNPYATQAPAIVTPDGKYLGKFSANPYESNSVSNPYGRYGNPYSPDSIRNPYGTYGVRNPYTVTPVAPALPSLPSLPTLPQLPRYSAPRR
jgi:hypothetical protein